MLENHTKHYRLLVIGDSYSATRTIEFQNSALFHVEKYKLCNTLSDRK
jgi:hypothetical protein